MRVVLEGGLTTECILCPPVLDVTARWQQCAEEYSMENLKTPPRPIRQPRVGYLIWARTPTMLSSLPP